VVESKPPPLITVTPNGWATRALRDHAARLPGAVVEGEVLFHGADGRHELPGAVPVIGLGDGAAVIADDVHRDDARAAGAIEMFGQPLIGPLGFVVVVGTDEAIEDLADGQRQVVDILVEDALHLIEQRERSLLGRPGGEATHTGAHALHAAEQRHRAGSGAAETTSHRIHRLYARSPDMRAQRPPAGRLVRFVGRLGAEGYQLAPHRIHRLYERTDWQEMASIFGTWGRQALLRPSAWRPRRRWRS
jgi:hypothetical protein